MLARMALRNLRQVRSEAWMSLQTYRRNGFAIDLPQAAWIGGTRSAHGRAASSCAASRNRVASCPKRPKINEPMGNPSSAQDNGTDIAGWPVMLAMGFHGLNEQSKRHHSAAPPNDWLSTPSGS